MGKTLLVKRTYVVSVTSSVTGKKAVTRTLWEEGDLPGYVCPFDLPWDKYQEWLDSNRKVVLDLYQSGLSVNKVSVQLRMHSQGVRSFLKHRGVLRLVEDVPADVEQVEEIEQGEMALV